MTHKWFVRLLLGALIVLLVAAILRALTPVSQTAPLTEIAVLNKDQTRSSFSNIGFSGVTITPPAKVFIAQASSLAQTKDNLEQLLISNFHLRPLANTENIWQGDDYSVAYNPSAQTFEVFANEADGEELMSLQKAQLSTAQTIASEFISVFFPNSGLAPLPDQALYLSSYLENQEVSPGDATLITIPFAYTIEGIPVMYNYQNTHPLLVTVTANRVVKAVLTPTIRVPGTLAPATSLTVAEAINNINTKQLGSIISATNKQLVPMTLDTIMQGNLTSVSFEYRLDEKSGLIYPYYHFKGDLINADGITLQVDLLTPAIHVDTTNLNR